MSDDVYELMTYWEKRQEKPETCATRFVQMATQLAEIDPVYGHWRKQAWTSEEANDLFCAMPPSIEELTEIFDKKRRYRNLRREPHSERGFWINVWNGLDGPYSVSLAVSAGACYDDRPAPNRVLLGISKRRLATGLPWTGSELKPLLLAVVNAWDAKYAFVRGSRFSKSFPPAKKGYVWP